MSAAATAAGYLYASGRLRGRAAREQEQQQPQAEKKPEKPAKPAAREPVRVAVLPPQEEKPRRTPKIEYRTRRRFTPE
jgi:hypothetical protein